MTNRTQVVPVEAVEAAAKAAYEDAVAETENTWGSEEEVEGIWSAESGHYKQLFRSKARIALRAAAPAIREQERERVHKALNHHLDSSAGGYWDRIDEWFAAERVDLLRDAPSDDISALEQELAKVTAHPEWGQGPGTMYYAQVATELAQARKRASDDG